jgi:hypothetical protein
LKVSVLRGDSQNYLHLAKEMQISRFDVAVVSSVGFAGDSAAPWWATVSLSGGTRHLKT